MTRVQCARCPWKVTTNPRDIPNGYCENMHRALRATISDPGSLRGTRVAMACHESPPGQELPCVGWMNHQLGDGNNLALRLAVLGGKVSGDIEVVGEQHRRFEDTLPRSQE